MIFAGLASGLHDLGCLGVGTAIKSLVTGRDELSLGIHLLLSQDKEGFDSVTSHEESGSLLSRSRDLPFQSPD